MSDDLDLAAIQTNTGDTTFFCSCGALIYPTAVACIVDNEKQWQLFDYCVDYVEGEQHVRRPRQSTQLLSSTAAKHKYTQDQVKHMIDNQLYERKVYFCKTCNQEQVHCIFMTSRDDMEILVVCVSCLSVNALKNVWIR